MIYSITNIDSSCNELSSCANLVNRWLLSNRLILNMTKTQLLNLLSYVSSFSSINIDNHIIAASSKIIYIGVTIDNKLTLNEHIYSIYKKANFHLYNIRFIRKYLSINLTESIVRSLVFSTVDYYNSILFGLSKKYLMKIKRIDHAAIIRYYLGTTILLIRLIFKLPLKNHSSINMRQLNLGILNTINRSKFKLLCINHKTYSIILLYTFEIYSLKNHLDGLYAQLLINIV